MLVDEQTTLGICLVWELLDWTHARFNMNLMRRALDLTKATRPHVLVFIKHVHKYLLGYLVLHVGEIDIVPPVSGLLGILGCYVEVSELRRNS